jgi:hypothetical protein
MQITHNRENVVCFHLHIFCLETFQRIWMKFYVGNILKFGEGGI